jgi:acyl-CoA synthetase (NDP forming)
VTWTPGSCGTPSGSTADACARYGLQVPPLSATTQDALAAILPAAGGAVCNPVDTTVGVSAELFGRVLETVAADPGIDAIVPILTPTAVSPTERVLDSLPVRVPVAAVLLGQREALTLHGRVPVYSCATAAIRALSHAAAYAVTRSCEPGIVPDLTGIDKEAAAASIGAYLAGHPRGGWLDGSALEAVASAYGLPAASSMIAPGTEMRAGFVRDPLFGPLVQVGAGGVTADLVQDRSARLLPLTDRDALDMIGSLRMAPLLAGFRGMPPLDLAALTDVLHRAARLAADLPSVADLDINPLILYPSGCAAAGVKIRVAPASVIDPYLRELR